MATLSTTSLASRFQVSKAAATGEGGDRAGDGAAHIYKSLVDQRPAMDCESAGHGLNATPKNSVTNFAPTNFQVGSSNGRRKKSTSSKRSTSTQPQDDSRLPLFMDSTVEKVSVGVDGLALYEEENAHMPKVEHIIRSLSVYNPLQPGTSAAEKESSKKAAGMGTFVGVFLPCIQNIFGVLFFIRLAWIVGTAGLVESIFIVLICCAVTFLTSISLSAIATNGMVPAGGPYYMISRNLGPELGGAVGILFYLGTTVAASMYILGAAEIFVLYVCPKSKIFDDIFMCYRLYGTCVLLFLSCIVLAGVKVVNKFALPTVFIVNLCIVLSFIGVFVKINGSSQLSYCVVGDRLVNMKNWVDHHSDDYAECNATGLTRIFCKNSTFSAENCDPNFFKMAQAGRIAKREVIRGLTSGVIAENLGQKYLNHYQLISSENHTEDVHSIKDDSEGKKLYVYADVTSSFIILVGVFFPSVTGIMAGSNRSGNLKDASRSIPLGTIAATSLSSLVYLVGTVFFAASLDGLFMRDKFGESAFGKLVISELAVPHPLVICIGSLIATTGAGMQSLTGAPRLLQAIAKDGVIPLLAPFQKTDRRGEPILAIVITIIICELGVLIAMLENITALISQFFLMCYLGVNSACALQSLMKAPSWRPRFRYYHWSLSMFGSVLCIAVMFMSNWIFSIISIIIGVVVYKYIEYRGAEKEWGDGIRGLGLSAARFALLNLEQRTPHTKNWRPQVLIFCETTPDRNSILHENLFAFVSQLKAGKGLTVVATVLEGNFAEISDEAAAAKNLLDDVKNKYKIKGFSEVLVSANKSEGINTMIQTSGLGGLKHNTVILHWPDHWKEAENVNDFVDNLRSATAAKCAVLVAKGIDNFPINEQRVTGKIDVWWIVHDGGMMILLPFLLKQHKTWKHTQLRIFTVAQIQDNSVKMKEDLKTFLYHLRINAEVDVIEMHDKDISEYTYERTLRMVQRSEILRELGLSGKEIKSEIQTAVVDAHHKKSLVTSPETESTKLSAQTISVSFCEPDKDPAEPDVIRMIDDNYDGTAERSVDWKSPDKLEPAQQNGNVRRGKVAASTEEGTPSPATSGTAKTPSFLGLHNYNVRRMHTAVKLNEMMRSKSADAQLLFVNLPSPPKYGSDEYYMEFIDALTEGLDRLVLVKGTGTEVVTIYS